MNWKKLIDDILNRGNTMAWIADEIGVSHATIRNLRRGDSLCPVWTTGDAIIRLHKMIVPVRARLKTKARPLAGLGSTGLLGAGPKGKK